MRYESNCPMHPEYFNPAVPVSHSKPVQHGGIQIALQDWPAECLWEQIQWEHECGVRSPEYIANLETEWQRRNLCSRCLRELDHPFMLVVDDLRRRAEQAEAKLAAIRDTARFSDAMWRNAVVEILDRDADDSGETPAGDG